MSVPKVHDHDYIQYLIAAQTAFSCAEAARVQPAQPDPPAHDAFTRLLTRREPDPEALWLESQTQVEKTDGVLVIDDSTLDKPYATSIALVTRHWSGKHHAVVRGINLVSLLWTDGDRHIPCDYRVYDPADNRTKNDHFADMIRQAYARGFRPRCVLFDSWYSSLDNLKLIRACGWTWLTRLKSNRLVRLDGRPPKAVKDTPVAASGTTVWLPGYGLVKVFGIVATNGDIAYWATNAVDMDDLTRLQLAEFSWAIEHYHRGIKQCTGIERCQCRTARAQRNHIGMALRAFLRFEVHCFARGISWVQAKVEIVREAVRSYLNRPRIVLPKPRTA
jgi:hypothetical protein